MERTITARFGLVLFGLGVVAGALAVTVSLLLLGVVRVM